MSLILKSAVKHKPACQFKPVATTPQACMTLSLATSTWEIIITSLTTQISQLRQHVDHQTESITPLSTKQCIKVQTERDRKNVKCGKQTSHRCKNQLVRVLCKGATGEKASYFIHNSRRRIANQADRLTRTETTRQASKTARQTTELLTHKVRTETVSQTECQHEQPTTMKFFTGVDRAAQTDAITESRGVNTIIKAKQRILHKVSPTRHFEKKSQQENTRMKKTSRTKKEQSEELTDVLTQEQLSRQEDTKSQVTAQEKLPEKMLAKVPENIDQLLVYTQQNIEELIHHKLISKPETTSNFCVFCKKDHHVSICHLVPLMNELDVTQYKGMCGICESYSHTLIDCKWIQVIDLAVSLTTTEQAHLLKACPFLKTFTDNPNNKIDYKMAWDLVKNTVQQMDTTQFKFPYVIKTSEIDRKAEKLLIKIPENSDQLGVYTQQKIDELISKNEICMPETGINFCVYCRQNTHNVSRCTTLKERSERFKSETDPKCIMCDSEHELLTCKWIQVLNIAHSLTP